MKRINDALVSVAIELILLIPKLVKGIAKRYKLLQEKRDIKSQVEEKDLEK